MDRGVKVEQVQQAVAMSRERGIQSGMFLMWGYEGEELDDIEATIEHVKRSQARHLLHHGLLSHQRHALLQENRGPPGSAEAVGNSSDRELKIKGRHSQKFYGYADRLLREEVQLSRLRGKAVAKPASSASCSFESRTREQA